MTGTGRPREVIGSPIKPMKLLITGICGFVGSTLARALVERGHAVSGIDNLIRPGAQLNRDALKRLGVAVRHGDLRAASDLEGLAAVDAVIDAAANPSVLAGVDGKSSSRQVVEHNLVGTLNLLEFCKQQRAALVLLSTSRVYSIDALTALPMMTRGDAFAPDAARGLPPGASAAGVDESFSTAAPVSLYGATKLASEAMALEYGDAFDIPVWVDRCGVLAGAGQFGHAEQGIFSYWLHAWRARRPLRYIGFGGLGHQVRDALHPLDLVEPILAQLGHAGPPRPRVCNFSGGAANAMSLRELSGWCRERWGEHAVAADPAPRRYDLPWVVLDASLAGRAWSFAPTRTLPMILDEIARFAEARPDWLELSGN